jgi:glycosidase
MKQNGNCLERKKKRHEKVIQHRSRRGVCIFVISCILLLGCGGQTNSTVNSKQDGNVIENTKKDGNMTEDSANDSNVTEETANNSNMTADTANDSNMTADKNEQTGLSETTDISDKTEVSALSLMQKYELLPEQQVNPLDDMYRTYYEVFLYSYEDSNGDGIGDLPGLTHKLDYIQELGCNGIWLMPIMPSPTYHKYDITDYEAIDPVYGTMEDFETFLSACQERGIRVILDLVMNHTSSKHPWFLQACEYLRTLKGEPDSSVCPYVNYYHFTKEKIDGTYYSVPGSDWYYEGHFTSDMPDLNLMDESVREAFKQIITFWLDKGVAGFRIDAAKEFESGSLETNVKILTWLTDTVKSIEPNAYLVAEVWTDLDSYAKYYGSGIDSVFDYTFGDQSGVIASVLNRKNGSNASTYGEVTASLQDLFGSYNPQFIDAPFYTNHDLGRSAGYYAGDGSEEKTKLAQAMNLLMTGNAFLYYGEEIGMKGSGKDENKRAPMYWTQDSAAEGVCVGPPGMDAVKMKFPSLEEQENDGNSIYAFVKETILLRNAYPAIARGIATMPEGLSNENLCVQLKNYQGADIALLWNIGETETTVELSAISLNTGTTSNPTIDGTTAKIGGALLTGTQDIQIKDGTLTLPPYSMVLLTP